MMLRIWLISMPSTARFRAFLRNGSETLPAACSRETIPCLRAWVAYSIISSMAAAGDCAVSKKTRMNCLTARIRTFIGVVTITAPKVPPRTMIAAETW